MPRRTSKFKFGKKSKKKLATCHPDLTAVARRAIKLTPFDFTIVHGWRDEATQNLLFESNASKTPWPESKHNHTDPDGGPLSLAIDIAPWIGGAIPWNDSHAFAVLAGVMFAAAEREGVNLRWGGDWNMNGQTTDQTFMDWGHLELKGDY